MEDENQTLEANPGEELTDAASAEGTQNDVVSQTAAPALSLEEINALTGHRYQTVDDARKGLDNLKRMVGKKEIVKEVTDPTLVETVKSLQHQVTEATFYTEHPDLKAHKDILSKFGNPYEAIKDPVVQKVVNAVKASEEKETLQSNSRINQPVSSADFEKDLESVKQTGDWVGLLKKHKGLDI